MTATKDSNALLLVYSEHGSQLTLDEFNDWYDNEHVPLRKAIPGFHTFTRLTQTGDKKPTWAAIYDVESLDVLNSGPYAALAETRSDREKDVLKRIGLLDRRLYRRNERATRRSKEGFSSLECGNVVVIVMFDVEAGLEDEVNRWYEEEHINDLRKVPGWLFSDRYILEEATITGVDKALYPEATPKVLAIHYFASHGYSDTEEYGAAITTPWTVKIMAQLKNVSIQPWDVYKTF